MIKKHIKSKKEIRAYVLEVNRRYHLTKDNYMGIEYAYLELFKEHGIENQEGIRSQLIAEELGLTECDD